MNGERDEARGEAWGDGTALEQAYARPEWLDEFADPPRGERADDDLWDPEPTGWRATVDRVRTTPRAAVALCAVGIVAAIMAAVAVFGSSGEDRTGQYPVVDFAGTSSSAARAAAPSGVVASGPASAPSAAPTELVVAVVGLVRAPGLHRLAPGARVADALHAARGTVGGADTAGLNLAQSLRDGDQVVVGVVDQKSGVKLRSAVVPSGGSGSGSAGGPAAGGAGAGAGAKPAGASARAGAPVNINTAGAAELDRLPGVGEATAAAIISYRDKHGPFASVDDLAKVSGIGAAKLAKIKPMATV